MSSKYVEIRADGFYFDEVKGEKSAAQLTLFGLSDVSNKSSINVNLMTQLEKGRVEYLIGQNLSFDEAKQQAQREVMQAFGFSYDNMQSSEMLDISDESETNAILLAISIILQGNRSVGDLTELIANFSTDIREDGIYNSESSLANLRASTLLLDLASIRTNLESRYESLGITTNLADFEKYISSFLAYTSDQPSAKTMSASNITTDGARLNAEINPNSSLTEITFEYGIDTNYGSVIAATQSTVSGAADLQMSAELIGLDAGQLYHFRVKAENDKGLVYGNDMTFNTLGEVPQVVVSEATEITPISAQLNGTVNANHLNTVVTFEYGITEEYGSTAISDQSPVSGYSDIYVSVEVGELTLGTMYNYRIVAENELGVSYSSNQTFTTNYDGLEGSVTDFDGNTYPTIGIGTQIWMAANLNTTHYANGELIADGSGLEHSIIIEEENPKYWFVYDASVYGRLYTWYAAADSRNICPDGWRMPDYSDWTILFEFVGGEAIAAGKLKEAGTSHWNSPNTGATNETGFTALPGGIGIGQVFDAVGSAGHWWSSSEINNDGSSNSFYNNIEAVERTNYGKYNGLSIRCIKDQ